MQVGGRRGRAPSRAGFAGRGGRGRVGWIGAERGAIYVEFLVAFLPVLTFFLGLLQLALIFTSQAVVQHAAVRGVRSAVVVLDDDPAHYDGRPRRGDVSYDGGRGGGDDQWMRQASSVLELGAPVREATQFLGSGPGPRLGAIQRAAFMPLATLAPSPGRLLRLFGMSGRSADELGDAGRFLIGMMLYNRAAAAITLRHPDGTLAVDVPSREPVTVRVTYLYYCSIPLAQIFLCQSLADLTGLTQAKEATQGAFDDVESRDPSRMLRAGDTLREGLGRARDRYAAFRSEMQRVAAPELLAPLVFTKARFRVLRAEATLPNQGACYYEESSCFGAKTP